MTTTYLKKLLLIVMLISAFGTASTHAQTKKKASTHKANKTKKTSVDNGDYYNGHKIYIGPRGGRYYINGRGNKVYI